MPYVKLKLCNWGLAPSEVIKLCLEFAERGLINLGQVLYYELLYKGMGANPHALLFGKAYVLAEAFIGLALHEDKNPAKLTVEEVRRILKQVPEIARAYKLDVDGEDWVLTLRAARLKRQLKPKDWKKGEWVLFFDTGGGEFHFLSIQGSELETILSLLSWLNGDRTEEEISSAFHLKQRPVEQFLSFVGELGLLQTSDLPFTTVSAGLKQEESEKELRSSEFGSKISGVELVGHSFLMVTHETGQILVDPAFIMPPPHNQNGRYFARMEEVVSGLSQLSGVIITHHHWDHLNLQTLARIPRDMPIYIPELSSQDEVSACNPSIKDFLLSLGFERVLSIPRWKPQSIGPLTMMPMPFFGEWFGPGSSFDGNTFLIEVNGKRLVGSIDADRNEKGDMEDVFRQLAESAGGPIDYLFFCCTGQQHRCATFCGSPFIFSNTFDKHAHRMRYHPNRETIARWCEILRPRYIIPYAQFIFHNDARRTQPVMLDEHFQADDFFRFYWTDCLKTDAEWLMRWKGELEALKAEVAEFGTELVMLGPGEMIQA